MENCANSKIRSNNKKLYLPDLSKDVQANDKDTITSIPINEELRDLGVTKFVKQGDLVQIIIDRHKVVSFNIHRKDFQQTMDRFRESALNGTAGLSRDTVKDMELLLVHPDNDYVKYLQSNGNGNASSESGIENLKMSYATVYAHKTSLYEAVIIATSNKGIIRS